MADTSIATCHPIPVEDPTDDELALAALRDTDAFAVLYHRYAKRVYAYLYSKVGHPADAEDLTAQVFTEMIESLARYRPRGTFAAWLFTIARRRAANWYRKKHSWRPIEAADELVNPQMDPLKQIIRQDEVAWLRKQIHTLKDEEIELLRLHFSASLTYQEIARVFGKTENAIRVSMHRLLHRLEANCEAENGE